MIIRGLFTRLVAGEAARTDRARVHHDERLAPRTAREAGDAAKAMGAIVDLLYVVVFDQDVVASDVESARPRRWAKNSLTSDCDCHDLVRLPADVTREVWRLGAMRVRKHSNRG